MRRYLISEDFAHDPDFIRLRPVGGALSAAHVGPVASKLEQIFARDYVSVPQQRANVIIVIVANVDVVVILLIELLGLGEGWGRRWWLRRPRGRRRGWILNRRLLLRDVVQRSKFIGDLVVVTVIQPDGTKV